MSVSTRRTALLILDRVLSSKRETVKDLLSAHLKKIPLSREDRTLLSELVYGTVRRLNTLDWHIAKYSKHKKIAPHILNIIRIGAYQLIYLNKIPAYAAINESVELAKKSGKKSSGFVNAVLRKIAAGSKEVTPSDFDRDLSLYLSIRYSLPIWMIERWKKNLNDRDLEKTCEAANETPTLSIRVNTLKAGVEEVLRLLSERGIKCAPSGHPLVFKMESDISLDGLDLFQKGFFFVQDESTVRVVDLMDPKPGDHVLDLCAAPGGKSSYMAQKMGNRGLIAAVDVGKERLKRLSENIKRMGTPIIIPVHADILKAADYAGEKGFDKVLLDAPCSNQGVLSKRVEARWRLRPRDIERLSALQFEMLKKASQFVKPGGVIVYSTCSIDTEEDERVVERFLASNGAFSLEKMFKTWPHSDKMDGSFAALLRAG